MSSLHASMENTDYDDLEGVSVIQGSAVGKWDDNDVKKISIYDVKKLDSAPAVVAGKYVVECLNNEDCIDSDLINIMLHLAVSLRNPDNEKEHLLKRPIHYSEKNSKYLIPYAMPNIQEAENTVDAEEAAALAALGKNINIEKTVETEEEKNDGEEVVVEEADKGPIETQAAAYSFMCAFLMRLQARMAEGVVGSMATAKARFASWYGDKKKVLADFELTVAAAEKVKEILSRKPEVTGTWVMWLATTENESMLLANGRGLIEYLGLQVFAYQGMHALTQVLAIHQLGKMPLKDLLKELDCPMTRDGLKEISKILRDYEQTTTSGPRKTYFRYSRIWDKKYFSPIQSKVCVPLLYVAARTVKSIATNLRSDPMKIYALQSVGDTMKETLERVAASLVQIIIESTVVDQKSGRIWDSAVAKPDNGAL